MRMLTPTTAVTRPASSLGLDYCAAVWPRLRFAGQKGEKKSKKKKEKRWSERRSKERERERERL